MSLQEVWLSSESNQYSWMLPAVLVSGFALILLMTRIKNASLRRGLKTALALIFFCLAVDASALQIREKWRLRYEWARQHESTLTDREQAAVSSDGANLVMGPVIYGGGSAVLLFGFALFASRMILRCRKPLYDTVRKRRRPVGL